MQHDKKFWDNIAEKYAADPIRNMEAYTYTLERTRSHLRATDHVIEMGCGTGSTALLLAPKVAQYVGTDISSGMIDIANRKLASAPVEGLHFETRPVNSALDARSNLDAVMAFNLLHLVRDIPAVLKESHRALKSGGLLITKTPCLKSATFKYQVMFKILPLAQMLGKAPFVQFFTTRAYDQMIEAEGFEIIESGNHPDSPPNRYIVARKL